MRVYSFSNVICLSQMLHVVIVLQNKIVSVFETTIRVLADLLSAHLIASDPSTVLGLFLEALSLFPIFPLCKTEHTL